LALRWLYELAIWLAAVGGPALGVGCDIAVFADIRVGSENAILGYPQIKFGLTPYFSPLWRIIRLSQTKLLTFSGGRIDAVEALRIGLIDRLAPVSIAAQAAMCTPFARGHRARGH
jgi:enoyl-CoA hydratase/carnithine racemase